MSEWCSAHLFGLWISGIVCTKGSRSLTEGWVRISPIEMDKKSRTVYRSPKKGYDLLLAWKWILPDRRGKKRNAGGAGGFHVYCGNCSSKYWECTSTTHETLLCVDIESWPAIMKQSRLNINEVKLYRENDKPPDQDGKQYKEKYFDIKKYFKFSFHYTSRELVR